MFQAGTHSREFEGGLSQTQPTEMKLKHKLLEYVVLKCSNW